MERESNSNKQKAVGMILDNLEIIPHSIIKYKIGAKGVFSEVGYTYEVIAPVKLRSRLYELGFVLDQSNKKLMKRTLDKAETSIFKKRLKKFYHRVHQDENGSVYEFRFLSLKKYLNEACGS